MEIGLTWLIPVEDCFHSINVARMLSQRENERGNLLSTKGSSCSTEGSLYRLTLVLMWTLRDNKFPRNMAKFILSPYTFEAAFCVGWKLFSPVVVSWRNIKKNSNPLLPHVEGMTSQSNTMNAMTIPERRNTINPCGSDCQLEACNLLEHFKRKREGKIG